MVIMEVEIGVRRMTRSGSDFSKCGLRLETRENKELELVA